MSYKHLCDIPAASILEKRQNYYVWYCLKSKFFLPLSLSASYILNPTYGKILLHACLISQLAVPHAPRAPIFKIRLRICDLFSHENPFGLNQIWFSDSTRNNGIAMSNQLVINLFIESVPKGYSSGKG